jgi:hypothetical protein
MFEGLFQPMHLLVIFVIALLIFGPKKLPLKEGMKDTPPDPPKAASTDVKNPDTKS